MTERRNELERAAKRGIRVTVTLFAVPLALAGALLYAAMRDNDALHRAAREGDVEAVGQVLDRHPARFELRNKVQRTPLHTAAWYGHTAVIEVLIRRGADVNAKCDLVASGDGQWNALHIAATQGNVEAARALIRGGTDFNAKSLAGETPLDVATRKGNRELADVLLAHGGLSTKK